HVFVHGRLPGEFPFDAGVPGRRAGGVPATGPSRPSSAADAHGRCPWVDPARLPTSCQRFWAVGIGHAGSFWSRNDSGTSPHDSPCFSPPLTSFGATCSWARAGEKAPRGSSSGLLPSGTHETGKILQGRDG